MRNPVGKIHRSINGIDYPRSPTRGRCSIILLAKEAIVWKSQPYLVSDVPLHFAIGDRDEIESALALDLQSAAIAEAA